MSNRVRLDDIEEMTIAELAELPPDQLEALSGDAFYMSEKAHFYQQCVHGALTARYRDKAAAARAKAGKDTGTVHFDDGEYQVTVNVPKKVTWDQGELATVFEEMTHANAEHYRQITLEVPESKYKAAPPEIQAALERARTVKVGKPKFTLTKKEAE